MPALDSTICDFGWRAVDFRLPGVDGRTWSLAEAAGPRGTLVAFICNHCPYVRATIDRLTADCRLLADEGIGAIAIMPNDTDRYPEDGFEAMQRFAAEHRLPFPYVIDRSQATARAYGAVCTPDYFGFNAALELQYRGRLDSAGRSAAPDARRELLEAMRLIAATGQGPREQTPSIGCSIKWREAA